MEYQIGNVYKIICSVNSEFIYIGSTFQKLNLRWISHKSKYNKYLKGGNNKMSIFKYYDKYGIQSFRIVLIKSYNVYRDSQRDHKHLLAFEQLWINKTKKSVNLYNAFSPIAKIDKKIYLNKYYQNNKEKAKEYYQDNKVKILEYYQTNKVKILEKKKEKTICECGINITKSNLSAHKKTKKHIKLMERYNKLKMLLLL